LSGWCNFGFGGVDSGGTDESGGGEDDGCSLHYSFVLDVNTTIITSFHCGATLLINNKIDLLHNSVKFNSVQWGSTV
jgi:hypothetical protein